MKIKPHCELWAARNHTEMKFFTIRDVEKEQLGTELGTVPRKMESQLTRHRQPQMTQTHMSVFIFKQHFLCNKDPKFPITDERSKQRVLAPALPPRCAAPAVCKKMHDSWNLCQPPPQKEATDVNISASLDMVRGRHGKTLGPWSPQGTSTSTLGHLPPDFNLNRGQMSL